MLSRLPHRDVRVEILIYTHFEEDQIPRSATSVATWTRVGVRVDNFSTPRSKGYCVVFCFVMIRISAQEPKSGLL
jgi:hypothetical protein